MMRSKTITLSPAAADADSIAESQTPSGAGNLTLTGATITFAQPAHVTVTSAGDDSGRTFTVTGTDRYGIAQTEAITGADSTVATGSKNFATVTQVAVDAATAGAVTAGNAASLDSQWIPWDARANEWSIQGVISTGGSLTWGIEHTNSNVHAVGFSESDADGIADAALTNESTSQLGEIGFPVVASRAAITSYSSGTLTLHIREAGA